MGSSGFELNTAVQATLQAMYKIQNIRVKSLLNCYLYHKSPKKRNILILKNAEKIAGKLFGPKFLPATNFFSLKLNNRHFASIPVKQCLDYGSVYLLFPIGQRTIGTKIQVKNYKLLE